MIIIEKKIKTSSAESHFPDISWENTSTKTGGVPALRGGDMAVETETAPVRLIEFANQRSGRRTGSRTEAAVGPAAAAGKDCRSRRKSRSHPDAKDTPAVRVMEEEQTQIPLVPMTPLC